jgi:hypothetical protein
MPASVAIGLTQLVLWYDATRIQAWPAFLASIPEGLTLPSATDFGRHFDTERMTDARHSAAEKIVRNLPGLEKKGERLILRGVGLLELDQEGYRLSKEAGQLRDEYRSDPRGKRWVRTLARLLLLREPRTRVVLRALSEPGAQLVFTSDGWFAGSIRGAAIERDGARAFPFIGDHPQHTSLRTLLTQRTWWSLGEWRQSSLLGGASDCHFTGTLQVHLSLHDVSLALRAPFEILLHLGVLGYRAGRCWLDTRRAVGELGSDIGEDFGWEGAHEPEQFEDLLNRTLGELRSDTGFVIAAELREALRREGIPNPDAEIGRLQSEGRLVIEAEEYGQSRHGEGLFGDSRKQMVQIRLLRGVSGHER